MSKVFQYGSNCDQVRLNSVERLNGSAIPCGKAHTVCGFEIAFDVWSAGNKCAASNLVPAKGKKAWGILYEIPDDRIDRPKIKNGPRTLAQIEGPSYEKNLIEVMAGGEALWAVTFVVKEMARISGKATSATYVSHIVKGLRDHDAPEEYINHVIDIAIANVGSVNLDLIDQKLEIENLRRSIER